MYKQEGQHGRGCVGHAHGKYAGYSKALMRFHLKRDFLFMALLYVYKAVPMDWEKTSCSHAYGIYLLSITAVSFFRNKE